MDLIDRYKKWRLTRGDDSETDSGGESGGENAGEDSDTDWNMTVRGPPPPAPDSVGYSEPINSVAASDRIANGDSGREVSPVKETVQSPTRDNRDRSSRSPSKEIRARSPEKQIIPTGLSPAKSEQQIVSTKKYYEVMLLHLWIVGELHWNEAGVSQYGAFEHRGGEQSQGGGAETWGGEET